MQQYLQYIPILVLVVAVLTYLVRRNSAKKVLKNKVLEKQVDEVAKLVNILNEHIFRITFTTFQKDGSGGGMYRGNIFEIEFIKVFETDSEFFTHSICLGKTINQLFNIKPFLNNPHIPVSIINQLEKFYSRRTEKISSNDIVGRKIVVIENGFYDFDEYDQYILK